MKKKLIIPGNIALNKKDDKKDLKKEEAINKALIQLRKFYLDNVKVNKKLDFTLSHFKKIIKSKDDKHNIDMISYFIFTDNFND